MKILYFGCIGHVGHYLFGSKVDPVSGTRTIGPADAERFSISHGLFRALDGGFCPPGGTPVSRYLASYVPPWTIVSWWDRSVDNRPGSHSTFLFETRFAQLANISQLLEQAALEFPDVMGRQQRPTPL